MNSLFKLKSRSRTEVF